MKFTESNGISGVVALALAWATAGPAKSRGAMTPTTIVAHKRRLMFPPVNCEKRQSWPLDWSGRSRDQPVARERLRAVLGADGIV